MGGNEHGKEQVTGNSTFNCAPVYSSCEYYKDNILLLNGSHLFSVISYVALIVINHPKL